MQDSPNSAGVVVDAVRFLQVARELGICGSLRGVSAFTQKSPPCQMALADAAAECEALARRELTAATRAQLRPGAGAAPPPRTTTTTSTAAAAALPAGKMAAAAAQGPHTSV